MRTGAALYLTPLLAGAGLALALALLAWRRPVRGRVPFALLMLSVAEWGALAAVELAAPGMATKVACAKLEYLGIGAVPPLWLLFTLTYEGSWRVPPRRVVAILWVIPAITFGLALTNERHGLIWSHIAALAPGAPLVYHHGPWFWIAATFAYVLLLGGSLLLLRSVVRAAPAYRGQAALLLAALAAPWLGNLAYLLGAVPIPGLDPTPFAFTLSGVLLFVDLARFRLLDLMPVAHATLVESMVDGVVVVDAGGRIVDLNPAARRLLGDAAVACIGREAGEVFAGVPALRALWDTRDRGACEIPSPADSRVYLEGRIVPLLARAGTAPGELLVLHDITERKQAEERTRLLECEQLARRQAEEALRVRADVLATVAHDLKNPLGTVKLLSQLLQRQATDGKLSAGPELAAKLVRIDDAATKMTRLIDEVLDVARLEAGRPLTLELGRTDLVALAQRVVAAHRASSPAHCLQVDTALPELIGQWDAFRLERVLDNLLGNALKYSPQGGIVSVRVGQERDDAVLEVVDQGVGIPAAALPHLFDRFHRADNVGAMPGTGLGLVGVRRIVEEHGGAIDIRSQEGQGTTVIIRLPRAPSAAPLQWTAAGPS